MAVLQKIRNRAGLLIGVLGVALLAFILSDLFTSSNTFFQKFKDKAFTIDGDVVSTGDYQQRINEVEGFRQFIFGKNQSGEADAVQTREMVYHEMVKEKILDSEAEKLGLSVAPEELTALVYGANVSPIFLYDREISQIFRNPQTGRFDQAMLIQFLTTIREENPNMPEEQKMQLESARYAWAYIEKKVKYQRLEEKYTTLVAGTFLVNDVEAKAAFEDSQDVASFVYTVKPYSALADSSVQVTDSEIKALYDKRKENYKINTELRKISYFIKDVVPSAEDYAAVEKDMNEAYEKLKISINPATVVNEASASPYVDVFFSVSSLPEDAKKFVETSSVGDVYGPVREEQAFVMYKYVDKVVASDSIHMQRIPMPATLDVATLDVIADSLINVIKKGKDFATVANEMWPESNGGELGWVTEAMLSSVGINKQCFAAAKGDVFKLPVNGQTWIVRISDKKAPVAKVKLASVVMPVVVSDKTQNQIDNELNQFVSENGNLQNFDKGAASKGYSLYSDVTISPSFMGLEQSQENSRQVIHWAFNNEVGSVNKFDLTDKRIIAVITKEITGDYMPLSEPTLSKLLKDELIRDKKAEKMIADMKAKNLSSVDAYAQEMGSKIDTVKFVTFQTKGLSFGNEPIFNVYAKLGQVNKLEAPLKGQNGVYALSIVEKTKDTKEFDAEQTKRSVQQENAYQISQSAVYVLREKMNVVDNRAKFW